MTHLWCVIVLFVLLVLCPFGSEALKNTAKPRNVTRIAFGSCNDQNLDQGNIWESIASKNASLFAWLGDIVYVDHKTFGKRFETYSPEELRAAYEKQKNGKGYTALRHKLGRDNIVGVWDDHDYGINDGGKEFPRASEVQQVFLDFFDVPRDSPRRTQKGVYSYVLHRGVLLILLDVRSFKDMAGTPNGDILGEEQWAWLEHTLRTVRSEATLIGSGIQVIPDVRAVEHWGRFPAARRRLLQLIEKTQRSRVVFLSGDVHFAEVSVQQCTPTGYPLWDVTSSGMTHYSQGFERTILQTPPNPNRRGSPEDFFGLNFGVVEYDWNNHHVTFIIYDGDGVQRLRRTVYFSEIERGVAPRCPDAPQTPATSLLYVETWVEAVAWGYLSALDMLIAALALIVLTPMLALIGCCWMCCCRRKKTSTKKSKND
eukprot:PhM_4_TR18459/c0_g1_i1/m.11654/K01113/phoD; alkaline phosphatase D